MRNKNDILLYKIIQYCEQIEGTVKRFGEDQSLFKGDYIFSNACNMCILQIGEIVGSLDDEFKQAYTEIPWRQIRSMRNIFAHNYHNLDYDVAWDAIINDVPVLKRQCERIYQERQNENNLKQEISQDIIDEKGRRI